MQLFEYNPASCCTPEWSPLMTSYDLVRQGEVLSDAVVVTVRVVHGQPMGDLACAHCPAAEEYAVADFPRPILIALERAEELRALCNLDRVAIALAPGARWNPDWGELEPRPSDASTKAGPSGHREQATQHSVRGHP